MKSRARLVVALLTIAVVAAAAGGFAVGRSNRPALLNPVHPQALPVGVSRLQQLGTVPALCTAGAGCPERR